MSYPTGNHDKSDKEIENITLADYENHKEYERMERNAWRVAHEIVLLIDDQMHLLSDYIRVFVTEWRRHFFATGPSFVIT